MNMWQFLDAHPWEAIFLVLAIGSCIPTIKWRTKTVKCPDCGKKL